MAQEQAPATQAAQRRQEGSRWINGRPAPDEVAKWFKDNVPIHEGLEHSTYVPGLLLIEQKETVRVARMHPDSGQTLIVDEQQLVYVPHVGVTARVRYWNDWLDLDAQDDVVGVLEVCDPAAPSEGLPPGFWWYRVPKTASEIVNYVGVTVRAGLYKADTLRYEAVGFGGAVRVLEGIPVRKWPPGSKVAGTLGRYGVDDNAIMKAETGAIGRALGFAGMLIIPGSGVATAEDMNEAIAAVAGAAPGPAAVPDAKLPADPPAGPQPDETVDPREGERQWIREKLAELQSVNPEGYEQLVAWSTEKKTVDLDKPTDTQLRGVRRQIEKRLPVVADVAPEPDGGDGKG